MRQKETQLGSRPARIRLRALAASMVALAAVFTAGCSTSSEPETNGAQVDQPARAPSGGAGEAASCNVTSADKTAVQEVAAALAEATPALTAIDGAQDDLAAAAQAATVMASTSRVSEERASSAALRDALSDYASGWASMAEYLQNLASGVDSDRGQFEAGRSEWLRGQDKLRSFIVDCDLQQQDFQ